MNKNLVTELKNSFDEIVNIDIGESLEYWFARDLMGKLGYDRWENFRKVVIKGRTSCEVSGGVVIDHFRDITKKVTLGSGAVRDIEDVVLTRYACYLIAQNGDSRKEEIAFAQTYFAVQTRKQELIEERILLDERLAAREKLIQSNTLPKKNGDK